MKTFACGDVVPGCSMQVAAASDENILATVAAHARADHGLETVPDELVIAVRAAIQPAA